MDIRAALLLLFTLCLALGLLTFENLPTLAETIDGRRVVIIDGDTIAIGSERVRILNVDTPETFRPRCEAELVAGLKAKERLAELLRAGPVGIERHGQDRYRRTLARLSAGGRDVGSVLVAEGLALPWRDGRAAWEQRWHHWCG
ncbi:thermonuclease family protein [Microvirga sp. HBU67558]|uniref:thermonuclease family protein n=1 Tax=Microvirga sp. HBU67558 TaxID=2824562 RepID=UPI001B35B6C3|nr:thermonuclease family protein [Microvirga sp. HBU67558]MBQ0820709.1 thermonuclease family protein [Microvirga sp. HBU67558]